jgi:hypothetical protein
MRLLEFLRLLLGGFDLGLIVLVCSCTLRWWTYVELLHHLLHGDGLQPEVGVSWLLHASAVGANGTRAL